MDEERFYRLAQVDQSGRFVEMLAALGPEKACAQSAGRTAKSRRAGG